jgi:hypothetical protein
LNIIFTGDISFDWLPQPGLLKQFLPNHNPLLSNHDDRFFNNITSELGISGLKAKLLKSKVDYQTRIISSGLSDLFNYADFVCANLECVLTNRGEALPGKKFMLRAEPYYLDALLKMNVSSVCLANNHILDYGPDGLDDTLKFLRIAGINYCGLKHKTNEKSTPYIFTDEITQVAILNYVEPEIIDPDPETYFKYDKHPVPLKTDNVIEDIISCSKDSAVIVVPHWGVEWSFRENERQQELAHLFIDNGACAVIGHHSHLAGTVEKYKDGIIAYSLGNLYMMLPEFSTLRAKRRFVVELDFEKNNLKDYKLIPLSSNTDSTPVIDDDLIAESFYHDFRPEYFPDKNDTVYDSYNELEGAIVSLESSGRKFNAFRRNEFYNEPKVVQGKLPLPPGWQIEDKFWCGTALSKEFMGNSYLHTNVSHVYDEAILSNKFIINRPFSKLHLVFGYPKWFDFIKEFSPPEFKIVLNRKEIFTLKFEHKLADWKHIEMAAENSANGKNEIKMIIKGSKDRYSYICWRVLAS